MLSKQRSEPVATCIMTSVAVEIDIVFSQRLKIVDSNQER